MLVRVRVDGVLSEAFSISNGIRQGCIAGPILFNLFYAAMLDDALRNINVSIQIRFRSGKLFKLSRLRASTKVLEELIQELLCADDWHLRPIPCTIFRHLQTVLQTQQVGLVSL